MLMRTLVQLSGLELETVCKGEAAAAGRDVLLDAMICCVCDFKQSIGRNYELPAFAVPSDI